MQLKNSLGEIIKTKTLRHFSITTFGTIINGFLGLLFYIVAARGLGPGDYGILAVAITTITLLADTADFGIDTATLRFIGKYRNSDKMEALKFLRLGLKIKFLVWLVILLLGWFVAPTAAGAIFLKPELSDALRFALVGVGGAGIFSLATHAIQAFEKFWLWSFLNIAMNTLRLFAVFILISFGSFNLNSSLTVYVAIPFLGFFTALFFLPNFLAVKKDYSVSRELFSYGKWVAIVGILGATSARLDTFISARLLSVTQVGIYSAAVQLTSVIPQLVFALATVVAPKLASFDTEEKAVAYLKKLQMLVGAIFILGVLLSPLSFFIIPRVYGEAYQSSVVPFIILALAQLVFLLALPAHQAIYYYFSKPSIFTKIGIVQLLVTAIGGWILISRFGVVGAALTVLINNLISFIIPVVWVLIQFRRSLRPSV